MSGIWYSGDIAPGSDLWNDRSRGFNPDPRYVWEGRDHEGNLCIWEDILDDGEYDDPTNDEMVDYLDTAGPGLPSRLPSLGLQGRRPSEPPPFKAPPPEAQSLGGQSARDPYEPPKAKPVSMMVVEEWGPPYSSHYIQVDDVPVHMVQYDFVVRSRGESMQMAWDRGLSGPPPLIPPPPYRPAPPPVPLVAPAVGPPRCLRNMPYVPKKAPPPVLVAAKPKKAPPAAPAAPKGGPPLAAAAGPPKKPPPPVQPFMPKKAQPPLTQHLVQVRELVDSSQPKHGQTPQSRERVQFTCGTPVRSGFSSEEPSGASGPIAVAAFADDDSDDWDDSGDSDDSDDSDDPGPPQSRQEPVPPVIAGGHIPVYDTQWFDRRAAAENWKSRYTQHSVALKWLSGQAEANGWNGVVFSNYIPCNVPAIVTDHPGVLWDPSAPTTPWIWQDMVAQLKRESMMKVVEGLNHRSRGIVGCRIQRQNPHGRMYQRAEQLVGRLPGMPPQSQWHFYLDRDDGTACRLHPEYPNSKVSYEEGGLLGGGHFVLPLIGMDAGGRDTYKFYRMQVAEEPTVLRFDGGKKPRAASRKRRRVDFVDSDMMAMD